MAVRPTVGSHMASFFLHVNSSLLDMNRIRPFCALCLFLLCVTPGLRAQGGASLDSSGYPSRSDYYTSFDGTKIYYQLLGEGEPVLLIHGFIVDGSSWKKTALYGNLQKAGFELIVPDLRGNGKSDKPHNPEAYAHDAEAKDLMGLLRKLGVKHYRLVGYSRGSIIAARLLVLDRRVQQAVLGGMGSDFTNPEWPRRIMFYKALSGDSVAELAPMIKRIKEAGLDQQALACMQQEQPSTSKMELAAVRRPVLVVCGDKDSDNGSSEELVQLIPGARHATVPGDHGSASRSQEFSAAVISFFRK